jgi:hypothetical protein
VVARIFRVFRVFRAFRAFRALLFLLILWSLPPQRVPGRRSARRRTVVTTNPLIGVHTRLTDEVEEWKVQRTLQMVREMGAPWIVEFFPWSYIEPRPGQFDWGARRHGDPSRAQPGADRHRPPGVGARLGPS